MRMRQRIARFGAAKPQAPVLDPLFKVIGKVGSVNQDQLEIYQRVRVRPYADLRSMDFVQVVTDNGTSKLTAGVGHP